MKDKLLNGIILGGCLGIATIFVPQIQTFVLGWMPENFSNLIYPVLIFAGLGAIIGAIVDRY